MLGNYTTWCTSNLRKGQGERVHTWWFAKCRHSSRTSHVGLIGQDEPNSRWKRSLFVLCAPLLALPPPRSFVVVIVVVGSVLFCPVLSLPGHSSPSFFSQPPAAALRYTAFLLA